MQDARRAPLVRPAVLWIAAGVLLLDQLTKWWAVSSLGYWREIPLVGDWLSLRLVHNSGAAFSLLDGNTWIVTIVMLAVTGGVLYYHRRANGRLALVLFGAALGGALGNLADRLFRDGGWGSGRVVDMIQYGNWFVGNVADIAIVGAAFVAVVVSWTGKSLLTKDDAEEAPAKTATKSPKASKPTP